MLQKILLLWLCFASTWLVAVAVKWDYRDDPAEIASKYIWLNEYKTGKGKIKTPNKKSGWTTGDWQRYISVQDSGNTTQARDFTVSLYPDWDTLFAGQEIRVKLSATQGEKWSVQTRVGPQSGPYVSNYWNITSKNSTGLKNVWSVNVSHVIPKYIFKTSGWKGVRMFNASSGAMGLRIISAQGSNRRQCHESGTTVWQQHEALAARSYLWGGELVVAAYATFTVPAFDWTLCYKSYSSGVFDLADTAAVWRAPYEDPLDPDIYSFNKTSIFWHSAADDDMVTGDYAAIAILPGSRWRYSFHTGGTTGITTGDAVKLVPGGMPCSYEKEAHIAYATVNSPKTRSQVPIWSSTQTTTTYPCYSNDLTVSGAFTHSQCVTEGSVVGGVGRIGTNVYNPLVTEDQSASQFSTYVVPEGSSGVSGQNLVAYFKLPAAGVYDVCYSPAAYRAAVIASDWISGGAFTPLWFKAFKATSTGCSVSSSNGRLIVDTRTTCDPAASQLVIRATPGGLGHSITWSTFDATRNSWGVLHFQSRGNDLALSPATAWDCRGCGTSKEYFAVRGGDQFRLVSKRSFASIELSAGQVTTGYFKSDGSLLPLAKSRRKYTDDSTSITYSTKIAFGPSQPTNYLGATSATAFASQKLYVKFAAAGGEGTYLSGLTSGVGSLGCFDSSQDRYGADCVSSSAFLTSIPSGLSYADLCSDTDWYGPTAGGNLGGNPRTTLAAGGSPLANSINQGSSWAYVRIPAQGSWGVCYRSAASTITTSNWRLLSWNTLASSPLKSRDWLDVDTYNELYMKNLHDVAYTSPLDYNNFTFSMNDTRAGTWGAIKVRDRELGAAKLTTMPSNYFTVPGATVHEQNERSTGGAIKLVATTANCWLSAAENRTESWDAGLPECSIAKLVQCASLPTQPACPECAGSLHSDTVKRRTVAFYILVPPNDKSYRVCFKYGARNWVQLDNPDYMSPELSYAKTTDSRNFVPFPAPQLNISVSDLQALSFAKVTVNSSAANLDCRPANIEDSSGDIMRLVPAPLNYMASVMCDATNTAGVSNTFNPLMTNWDLGVWCHPGHMMSTSAGGLCHSGKITPGSSTNGAYPYVDVDSTANSDGVSGTVGFLTLPPASSVTGYKLCYKQAGSNWVEIYNSFLQIATAPSYTYTPVLANGQSNYFAGQYGQMLITGQSADSTIDARPYTSGYGDILKLVLDSDGGCDRPAAGTGSSGNENVASTYSTTRGGGWTAATSTRTSQDQASNLATAWAWLIFPTQPGVNPTTLSYKVCLLKGNTQNSNWFQLGTTALAPTLLSVKSLGVTYTVSERPIGGATIDVVILSEGTHKLNTNEAGDQIKLVSVTEPCFGSEVNSVVPVAWTDKSQHLGLEEFSVRMAGWVMYSQEGKWDLGPSDTELTLYADATITLPHVSTATSYKICYRPMNFPFMEIEHTALGWQVYGLGPNKLRSDPADAEEYEVSANLVGQIPDYDPNSGMLFSQAFIAGVSTHSGSAGSGESFLNIKSRNNVVLTNMDAFKFVQVTRFTPGFGWTSLEPASCASPAFENRVYTGSDSLFWDPTLRLRVYAMLPTVPGHYLVCLKRSNQKSWVVLKPASASPALATEVANGDAFPGPVAVISSGLGFRVSEGRIFVYDHYVADDPISGPVSVASIDVQSYVYIVNQNEICGKTAANYAGQSFNAQRPLNDPEGTEKQDRRSYGQVENIGFPLASNYTSFYKVCYRSVGRSSSNTTGYLPFVQGQLIDPVWYVLKNLGTDNGAGSHYYSPAVPTKLSYSCPLYNDTYAMRTGETFDIKMMILDGTGVPMVFSKDVHSYVVKPVVTGFSLYSPSAKCGAENDFQTWTQDGSLTYRVSPQSACDSTTKCKISFELIIDGVNKLSGPECVFQVMKTKVDRLVVRAPLATTTTVDLNENVAIRAVALDADGDIAYASTDAITITWDTSVKGVKPAINGKTLTTAGTPIPLVRGKLEFTFTPVIDVTTVSSWSTAASLRLDFVLGQNKWSYVFTVNRPKLFNLNVVDIYAVNHLGRIVNDQKINMVPKWEPTALGLHSTGGFWSAQPKVSAVSGSGSGHYLVAGQYYTVVLQAVDSNGKPLPDNSLLFDGLGGTNFPTLSINPITDNKIIAPQSGDAVENPHHETLLTATSLNRVTMMITFRLQSTNGCRYASGGCKLSFLVNGANPSPGQESYLHTYVRGPAVKLQVQCVGPLDAQQNSLCTGSYVEKGLDYKVTAVDQFNLPDEFNFGFVQAALQHSETGLISDDGVTLTTTANLLNDTAPVITDAVIQLNKGEGRFTGLTLDKPRMNVPVNFLSNWGANIATQTMNIQPSIKRLKCTLLTNFALKDPELADLTYVSGSLAKDLVVSPTGNAEGLAAIIYKDTPICVLVQTADSAGDPVNYGTHWVMGWTTTKDGVSTPQTQVPTMKGNRIQALSKGRRKFCFTVDHSDTREKSLPFFIRFAAQRFTEWHGANAVGTCTIGWFRVEPNKLVNTIAPTSITGVENPVKGNNWKYGRLNKLDDALSVTVKFTMYDHYGLVVTPDNLYTLPKNYLLVMNNCNMEADVYKCASSDGTTTISNAISVSSTGIPAENGMIYVKHITSKLRLSDPDLSHTLTVERFCLKCTLGFRVVGNDGSEIVDPLKIVSVQDVILTVLPPVAMEKIVAFKSGESPIVPRVGSSPDPTQDDTMAYWKHYDCEIPNRPSSGLIIFDKTSYTLSNCEAQESLYLQAACDDRLPMTPGVIDGPGGSDIKLYVINAETPSLVPGKFWSPYCGSNSGTCTAAGSADGKTNVVTMVDFENTYTVTINIGTQRLSCVGSRACDGEGTKDVSQIIGQKGANTAELIQAAISRGHSTTAFKLVGLDTSTFYPVENNLIKGAVEPNMKGDFLVKAVTGATGATNPIQLSTTKSGKLGKPFEFVWRGPNQARRFEVVSTARDMACPAATSWWVGADADGYKKYGKLPEYEYAAVTNPVGEKFPITIEVQDKDYKRVTTAGGKVKVQLDSWNGCQNGGTMTVDGGNEPSLTNGRVTMWVAFSAPCDNCVLRFTLTIDPSQETTIYCLAQAGAAPCIPFLDALKVTRSHPFQVGSSLLGHADRLQTLHDSRVQSDILKVADVITLEFEAFTLISNIPYVDGSARGKVWVYNKASTSLSNPVWWGNGGILRKDADTGNRDRHAITADIVKGRTSIVVGFTRTCQNGCSIVVRWMLDGTGSSGIIAVRNSQAVSPYKFTVRTQFSRKQLVGYMPGAVNQGDRFAAALWSVGDELDIKTVGVAVSAPTTVQAPVGTAIDRTNGRGGDLDWTPFFFNASEAWRLSFPEVCKECQVKFGAVEAFSIFVYTKATRLLVSEVQAPDTSLGFNFAQPFVDFNFGVYAADEDGFMDVTVGGNNDCRAYPAFTCVSSQVPLSLNLAYTPRGDPFPEYLSRAWFRVAGKTTPEKVSTPFAIKDGNQYGRTDIDAVSASFLEPVVKGYTIFTTASPPLSSQISKVNAVEPPTVSVLVGRSGLSLAVAEANPLDSYQMIQTDNTETVGYIGDPLNFTVGFVRELTDPEPKYVSAEAHLIPVTISFSDACGTEAPQVAGGQMTKLTWLGMVTFTVVFKVKTTDGNPCLVTFTTKSSLATVKQANAKLRVDQILPDKWKWVAPGLASNNGAGWGPKYAVAERRTEIQVSLIDASGRSALCDTCKLTLEADDSCTLAPTFGHPSGAVFGPNGIATTTVTWAKGQVDPSTGSLRTYTCKIVARVEDTGVTLTPAVGHSADNEVTVYAFGDLNPTTGAQTNIYFATNVTTDWPDYLLSGRPYPFHVQLQSLGVTVFGDDGIDATSLTIDVVESDGVTVSQFVKLLNVNMSMPYAVNSAGEPILVGNSVKASYGGYYFNVLFSNATVIGSGVRIRVMAKSTTPEWSAELLTPPIDVIVSAQRLRVSPSTPLPSSWIYNRPLNISGVWESKAGQTGVVVQAVDGLRPEWSSFLQVSANVATKGYGSKALVGWFVDPIKPGQDFPLVPVQGRLQDVLNAGEGTFWLKWRGDDGMFRLIATAPENPDIEPYLSAPIQFQKVTSLRMDTTNFRPETLSDKGACRKDCLLPNSTFLLNKNGTVTYLDYNVTNTPFNFTVFFADALGQPAKAESFAFLKATLINTQPKGLGPTLTWLTKDGTAQNTISVKAIGGKVTLWATIVGSTMVDGNPQNHSAVFIEFTCDADVPFNPCRDFALAPLRTAPIRVLGKAFSRAERFLMKKPTIQFQSRLTSVDEFDRELFIDYVVQAMWVSGYIFVTRDLVKVTTCEVDPTIFKLTLQDLTQSSCNDCNGPVQQNSDSICINRGIVRCECSNVPAVDGAAVHQLRKLFQSPAPAGRNVVVIEMTIDLTDAVAWPATDQQESQVLISEMENSMALLHTVQGFTEATIQITQPGTPRTFDNPVIMPPTNPPATPPPQIQTPKPVTVPPKSSAGHLSVSLLLVVASLFFLM